MHVLYIHQNFPAQFGHIAAYLIKHHGFRATFVSQTPPGKVAGIRKIQYSLKGGATERTHYFSRTFENATWHAAAVYEAMEPLRTTVLPDLIVGHSGFGSTLFLPELWPDAPVINHFEYFYRPHASDMDFRPEFPVAREDILRSRARNAMILLDLNYSAAGYSPTRFQHSLLPEAYRDKVRVIHDGVDTAFWRRRRVPDDTITQLGIGPDTRVVTYCSRGLESMRGFDIFMRVAKRIYQDFPDVVFLVVGADRVAYGGDLKHIPARSFKEWVLEQDDYDLSRIRFLGNVAPELLAHIFSLTDLHIYLTVPFVLSWSVMNAMACGAVILGSNTAPVREVITEGRNGLLRDFFDVEGLAEAAIEVLKDPGAHRGLGTAARATIEETYSLDVVLPQMLRMYDEVAAGSGRESR
jgi:glycosyltransferase involved in cell wall biosynthesis